MDELKQKIHQEKEREEKLYVVSPNIVLNDKELAKQIDPSGKIVTTWTIRRWRLEGGMPYMQVGKRIFFKLNSVLDWINKKEKETSGTPVVETGVIRVIR